MSRSSIASLIMVLASSACVEQSPMSPQSRDITPGAVLLGQAVPGSYELEFFNNSLQVVTSLPIFEELVLRAHVEDAAGVAVTSGSAVFEYCSKPGPKNKISHADEQPLSACANGDASWVQLTRVSLNSSGNAFMNFGFVRIREPLVSGSGIRAAPLLRE